MKIVKLDTKNIKWQGISAYSQFVSLQRRQRINRFANENDKILSLFSELIIRINAREKLKIPPDKIEFEHNPHGKPSLKGVKNYYFSISHSKSCIVFTDSPTPIGIDTEFIAPRRERVQKKYFTPSENNFIENSSDKDASFFRIWTSKEAYVKMLGTGLSKSIKSFDVLSDSLKPFFRSIENSGYMITVCSENILQEEITLQEENCTDILNKIRKYNAL